MQLERLVLQDPALQAAGKAALQATIGAYSTYPTNLKHIFHVKSLHLGHIAKSFALREAPSEGMGASKSKGATKRRQQQKRDDGPPQKKKKTLREAMNEEFGAGAAGDQMVKRSKQSKKK